MRKTKEQVRKEILGKLSRQPAEEALRRSRIIKKRLFSLPEFKKAKFVMLYASKPEEVKTDEIIDEALEAGKKVALPLCTSQNRVIAKEISDRNADLEKGIYDIREPRKCREEANLGKIDLVVVPGVAFDAKKTRLGRGRGYYDKFLNKLPRDKTIIGLAFDFQIVKNLPKDSHDIPVSKVITG